MILSEGLLNSMKIKAQRYVSHAESLHLSSIAKSIEHEQGCQIFIEPFDENEPHVECTGCLATYEPCILRDIGKSPLKEFKCLNIRHHFIFYRQYPDDVEVERFRIAHELGHCAIHWPLGHRSNRLFRGSYHGMNDLYMVRFLKEEEKEADAFACLLTAHRPAVQRNNLDVNDFLFSKIKKYTKLELLQSMRA